MNTTGHLVKEQINHNALNAYFEKRCTAIIAKEEYVEKVMTEADNGSSNNNEKSHVRIYIY